MKNVSLKLQNISKSFYERKLFDLLSFEFNQGIFALIGANGIGKSTLLNMLTGSVPVDSGNIIINGIDLQKHPVAAKHTISYIPDKAIVYPFLTGKEFIHFITAIKKTDEIIEAQELISEFNLNNYMNISFSEMSLGTQKKFMIVAAIIGNPFILVMDEPTNALESSSRDVFVKYLSKYVNKKILIMATHDKELVNALGAKKILLEKNSITEFKICN